MIGMKMKVGLVAVVAAILGLLVGVVMAMDSPKGDSVAILKTEGMTCNACAVRIKNALSETKGVESIQVDVSNGRVDVTFDSGVVEPEKLADKVTETGYASKVARVLTKDQYAAAVPGESQTGKVGCACCGKK